MEIIINKKSWHYRWYRWITNTFRSSQYYWRDPRSLCEYFWGFILNNIWAVFLCMILVLLGVAFSTPIWAGISLFIYGGHELKEVFLMGCTFWIILLFFIAANYLKKHGYKIKWILRNKKEKISEISFIEIALNSIWGTYRKVCPIIKYKDE